MRAVAKRLFPKAEVRPLLLAGATDSRFLRLHGVAAYGTGAFPVSQAEVRGGHGSHGPAERRPVAWWGPGVRWLRELVGELVK
jgi:hypothetical protein